MVVSFEENVGVIGMDFNGLKCYLCSEDNCIHVKYLQKLDPSEASTPPCVTEFFEIASASSSNYRKLICLSKSKIMFNANDIYKECLRKKPSEYLELKNNNWYLAQTRCFKCSCLADNESTSVLEKSIKLYTKIEVFPCVGKIRKIYL